MTSISVALDEMEEASGLISAQTVSDHMGAENGSGGDITKSAGRALTTSDYTPPPLPPAAPDCSGSDMARMSGAKGGGAAPRLLLLSVAGLAAAGSIATTRLLALEAGEVLLLFASTNRLDRGTAECALPDGVDPDFASCLDLGRGSHAPVGDLGEALLAAAASPHLRAAPLILLFLSSATLVAGAILTRRELRRLRSRVQACRTFAEECSRDVMVAMGASNWNDLIARMKCVPSEWRDALRRRLDETDMDGVLREWTRAGVELSAGIWGGILLYSLPEEAFAGGSSDGARAARRRLVCAADPLLERCLFRPGGAWELLPPRVAEALMTDGDCNLETCLLTETSNGTDSHKEMKISSPGSAEQPKDDEDVDDEDSSDTPLASPLPPAGFGDPIQNVQLVRCSPAPRAKGAEGLPVPENDGGSKETVAEALSAIFSDLVVSHLEGSGSCGAKSGRDSHHGSADGIVHETTRQPREGLLCGGLGRAPPPPPRRQLEKYLRRLAVGSTLLFMCHLCGSRSARRAWISAGGFLASLGLASSAVGAGVASAMLGPGAETTGGGHTVLDVICSRALGRFGTTQLANAGARVQWAIDRMVKEIRQDKRLQAAFAFIVLYGAKSACRRNGAHVGSHRRGVKC